jgi:TonB-dependent starch-binding outer membrane protein SusC
MKNPVRLRPALILAIIAGSFATAVSAQDTGAATGSIFDLVTGRPVAGARVRIEALKKNTRTKKDGTFRIEDLKPGEQLVRIDANGYVAVVEKVIVDAGWTTGVEVGLAPMVAMLDALVVQAGLGSTEHAAVDVSSRIRPSDTDVGDTFSTLNRVPGVQVMRPSGTTGSGGRILLRGISSLSLSNDPVIYVDGVRVSGGQQIYGAESRGAQGQASYLLDFVDPRDIDRIEILRGPATATRYGLDASNGVILIYTKRGGGA